MLPTIPSPAMNSRHTLAVWWRRLVLCAVACCVSAQGLALSAERALGGRHFHLMATHGEAPYASDLDGHRYAPEILEPSDDQAVEHMEPQTHDHEVGLPGVIHVADDGEVASPHPHATLVRSVHDLDLLIPLLATAPGEGAVPTDLSPRPGHFQSHIGSPLERPPRP